MKPASKKVLLVDSDPLWQKFCKIKFRETYGIETVCASDCETARHALNAHSPAVIMMEMILPGEDGFNFLKEIKAKSWSKNIPVVVVSNLSHHEHIKDCLMSGAHAYFNKNELRHTDHLASVVRQYI